MRSEGNNICFLSDKIKNVIVRWDANIDSRNFELYSDPNVKERKNRFANENIESKDLGGKNGEIISQVIVENEGGLIVINFPHMYLLQELYKGNVGSSLYTALNHPVIGIKDVVTNKIDESKQD